MKGVKASELMELTNNLINYSEMRITKGANHQTCKERRSEANLKCVHWHILKLIILPFGKKGINKR